MTFTVAFVDDVSAYSQFLISEGLSIEGLKVHFYGPKNPREKFVGDREFQNFKNVWAPHLYPFQLFKQIMSDRPNVVHVQFEVNTFGSIYSGFLFPLLLLLLKLSLSKVIVTLHSVFTPKELRASAFNVSCIINFGLFFFYKLVELLADSLIVHASTFKKQLIGHYGLSAQKIYVIPHGISSCIKSNDLTSGTFSKRFCNTEMILFFGVLSPRKGLDFLLKSFRKVVDKYPESILVIAGEDPVYFNGYARKLKSLSNSLNICERVIFTGFISDKDVHNLFCDAKIVVLPYVFSVSASGPLSLAIEHKKPIIATRTVFFDNVLEDGKDSLLVAPKNVDHLADAIITLLGDEILCRRLSDNLKTKSEKYSWANVGKMTQNLYKSLL